MDPTSPLNPYAPPAASTDGAPEESPQDLMPASLGRRWFGAMVDNLLAYLVMSAGDGLIVRAGEPLLGTAFETLVWWAPYLAVWSLQSYFIVTRGQSIGKMLARTRIVDLDGNRVPFGRVAVLRTWVFLALVNLPVVGRFIHLVDALFIFGDQHRCLHDRVAGTKVIHVLPSSDPNTT